MPQQMLETDVSMPSSEIACFAGPRPNGIGSTHNHLSGLDHRIWRGSLIEPDRRIDGHPSWNEVLELYRDKLRGRSLEERRVEREMDGYMCLNVYKKQKKEVFCAGCEHYLSEEPCLSLDMVKLDIPLQKSRGVWVCEFLLDDEPVHAMFTYKPQSKEHMGYYQFWLTGGGYSASMGLAIKGGLQSEDRSERNKHTGTFRAPSHVLGSLDPDTLLMQVNSPAEDGDVGHASSNPRFSAINQPSTKRKGTESATGIRKKLPKYGPNSGVFDVQGTESTSVTRAPQQPSVSQNDAALMPLPGFPASATQQPGQALKFRPRVQHDYSQQILSLFRDHEHLTDCEYTKEWKNKAALQELSTSDLEVLRKPVYFRGSFTSRTFNGSPYLNMEAALTQMSGDGLVGREACERCQTGCGPFTTCVVGRDLHKGACANCVYNSQASKCSFREARPSLGTGQGPSHIAYGNNVRSHVHRSPWTALTSARQSLNSHDNRSEATSDGLFLPTRDTPSSVSSGHELYKQSTPAALQRGPDPSSAENIPIRLTGAEVALDNHRREVPQANMISPRQTSGALASPVPAVCQDRPDERFGGQQESAIGALAPRSPTSDQVGDTAFPAAHSRAQPRASGSITASDSASKKPTSEGGSSAYNAASFLARVTLVVNIEDDPSPGKAMSLAGCSNLDALIEKLTNRRYFGRVIPDHLAILSINVRVPSVNTVPIFVLEPGDVTLYARLLKHIRAWLERGDGDEIALEATIELLTSV
ncbi:hypothetical protein LTR17_016326 [Elasticomyces elasticus]|nr:hypothetical protein LTR17_016326 [Elasticomyces elasticus]